MEAKSMAFAYTNDTVLESILDILIPEKVANLIC